MADNFDIKDFTTETAVTIRSSESTGVHTPHHIVAAGENHMGEVSQPSEVIDVTLALDTSIYADGDVLSDTATLSSAMRVVGGKGKVTSITVIDEDDQGIAFDVVFFKVTQSLGTKNSPPSIADSNARDCLGFVSIATGDFIDLGGVRVACKRDINLAVEANTGSRDLFVGTITRGGTPTYTASGLRLKVGFSELS